MVPRPVNAQLESDAVAYLRSINLPNGASKSIQTPTGWGAGFRTVFAGFGFSHRTPYLENADGVVSAGFGIGDPILGVGLQGTVTLRDMNEVTNFVGGLKLHRWLAPGTSLALGVDGLFVDEVEADYDNQSYYAALSHVVQGDGPLRRSRPGVGALHFTVGAGTGRFAERSPLDVQHGKDPTGTYVFGNVAYEVVRNSNVVVEWSGINLNAGVTLGTAIGGTPVGFAVGLSELTSASGNGARFVASGGFGKSFFGGGER